MTNAEDPFSIDPFVGDDAHQCRCKQGSDAHCGIDAAYLNPGKTQREKITAQ